MIQNEHERHAEPCVGSDHSRAQQPARPSWLLRVWRWSPSSSHSRSWDLGHRGRGGPGRPLRPRDGPNGEASRDAQMVPAPERGQPEWLGRWLPPRAFPSREAPIAPSNAESKEQIPKRRIG